MNKSFTNLLLVLCLITSYSVTAQYCGSSQVTNCGSPTSTYGFPPLDSVPCIVQGVPTTLIIKFKTYNSFSAAGQTVTVDRLRIDTISNIPSGMCWSTNKPDNSFIHDENGCFQFQGTTNDPVGEYKLNLILSVNSHDTSSCYPSCYDYVGVNANLGSVYMYLRVVAPAGTCAPADTSQPGLKAGGANGIESISNQLTGLSIQPNPLLEEAKVTFTSQEGGVATLKIIDIVGREVYMSTIAARAGVNETSINRTGLPAGIYILSVGGSSGSAMRKFTIID